MSSKSFPGVKALDHANLTVRSHSVHALMGENGAGKSTLMNILTGIHKADAGKITIDGVERTFPNPREAELKRCSFHPPRAQHLAKSNIVRKSIFNETEAQ